MKTVVLGDTVHLDCVGTLADGRQFLNSAEKGPVSLEIGSGSIFPALENAIVGMKVGDAKTVVLAAVDAFGEHDPELVHALPRDQVPSDIPLNIGAEIVATNQSGEQMSLLIKAVDAETVTVDANHPLAGEELTFAVTLKSILD